MKRLFLLFSFVAMSGVVLASSMEMLSASREASPEAATPEARSLSPLQATHEAVSSAAEKATTMAAGALAPLTGKNKATILDDLHPVTTAKTTENPLYPIERPGFAGGFLASHFAQSQYDWDKASTYLEAVLKTDQENQDLVRRAMILGMGAGDFDKAAGHAAALVKLDPSNSLAQLILTVEAFRSGDKAKALAMVESMDDGDISNFIRPMLNGWAQSGKARYKDKELSATTIHMYSGALMALYEQDEKKARDFTRQIVSFGRISPYDAERAADLFAWLGDNKEATLLYEGVLREVPHSREIKAKLKVLAEGKDAVRKALSHLIVDSPSAGAAVVLFDMARILHQEQSDSSAKLFAQMALALNPDYLDAQLLLADTVARNGRYEEAVKYFSSIRPDHPSYLSIQRHVADLLLEAGKKEHALALLNQLFQEFNDVESLIKIGDIHRNDEAYGEALSAYNQAAQQIGENIPEEYWHLLYARGMAYEREGKWVQAESDLKAALAYRPDNPYLLNYLAYGWADQGKNLDESLSLIQRAASILPRDAYITDSLGWVLYRMNRYEDAIPHLEKAVELMPYDPTLNDHLGDAYWQVGRHTEARYQWQRAMNNSTDPGLKTDVEQKLYTGLTSDKTVREAKSDIAPDMEAIKPVPATATTKDAGTAATAK